jgi:hypothetical protein
MDDEALKQEPKCKSLRGVRANGGENTEYTIQRIKEAKVMFNNKNQLLYSNNFSLEMKKKIIKVVFGVLLFVDQKHGP